MDDTLHSGQVLVYTDDMVIDTDVVSWYRNHGVTPCGGEHKVYPKVFRDPLKAEIQTDPSRTSVTLSISARTHSNIEIDWGDNSPADLQEFGKIRHISHNFDNTVAGVRRIKLYSDPLTQLLNLTELYPTAIYLYRPFPVEDFVLRNARLDLTFISLLENVQTIDLRGTVTNSLLPLLNIKTLMVLDLRTQALSREAIDHYLMALVDQYYGRRSCTIRLLTAPSGQYREPVRDDNGRYRLTSGMEAVWVLTHEESWNEAGIWRIIIGEMEYTYQAIQTETKE